MATCFMFILTSGNFVLKRTPRSYIRYDEKGALTQSINEVYWPGKIFYQVLSMKEPDVYAFKILSLCICQYSALHRVRKNIKMG